MLAHHVCPVSRSGLGPADGFRFPRAGRRAPSTENFAAAGPGTRTGARLRRPGAGEARDGVAFAARDTTPRGGNDVPSAAQGTPFPPGAETWACAARAIGS